MAPEQLMRAVTRRPYNTMRPPYLALLLLALALAGCATPGAPSLPPAPVHESTPPTPVAAVSAPSQAAPATPAPSPTADETSVVAMLAHADRMRTLTQPELAYEIARLGATPATPEHQMQLALALAQTQTPADSQRAQTLLNAVLASESPEARRLHPFARLLSAQQMAQRKLEEQVERNAQQLRESQRRTELLSERLEALRAIERGMPSRPTRPAR